MLPGNHKKKNVSKSNGQDDNADLDIIGDQLIESQNQLTQYSPDFVSLDHNYHQQRTPWSESQQRSQCLTNVAYTENKDQSAIEELIKTDGESHDESALIIKSMNSVQEYTVEVNTQSKQESSNERLSKRFFKSPKDLERNNSALKEHFKGMSQAKQELTLKETNEELKRNLGDFQILHLEEIAKKDKELDSNLRMVNDLTSKCYSLQDELSNSKDLATSLNYKQSKDKEKIKSLQEEKSKNIRKLKTLDDSLKSKSAEIDILKVNIEELKCQINTLKHEVKRKDEEHKKEMLETTESKIESIKTFLKIDDLTVLSNSIDELSSRLKILQSKPNISQKQVIYRQALIDLLKQIQEFKTKQAETEKELRDVRAKNTEIVEELQDLKTSISESTNLIESMSNEINATKVQLELNKKSNQINEDKLVLSNKVNEDLKSQIKVLKEDAKTKIGEKNKTKQQNNATLKKLVSSNKLNKELKCQNQRLKEEAETIVQAINTNHTETIKAIISDLKARTEELDVSKKQNGEMTRKLNCSNKLRKELESQVKVLNNKVENNLKNHQDELQAIESKNAEVLDLSEVDNTFAERLESSFQLNDELRAEIDMLNKYIKDKELVKLVNEKKEDQLRILELNEKIKLKDDQIKHFMKKEEQYWSPKVKNGNGKISLNQNDNQVSQEKFLEYEKLNKTYLSMLNDKDNEIRRFKKRMKNMEAHLKELKNNVPESSLAHSKSSISVESAISDGSKKRRI